LYGLLPTIVALIIALGMFAVFRSTLNALTLGCLASLIGFGMDYTLHVLQRAFTEQAQGLERTAALRLAIRDTGGALLLATTTTMACYLAFLVAHQPFLHDLGLLAALGMGLSCVLSVTFLPALLVLLPQPGPPRLPRTLGLPRLSATVARYPRSILALSLLLSLVAAGALWLWPPRFETDLRNIHAANSPTLQVQARIATLFGGSHEPLMLLVEQSTEAQVLQDLQRLQPTLQAMIQDGLLAAVTSPAMLYPEHAAQHAAVQPLHTRDIPQLLAVLRSTLANAGFDERAIHDYSMRVQHALSHRESIDLATFRRLGFDTLLQPLLAHDARGAVGVAMLFPTNDLWTHATRDAMSQRLTTTLATEGIQGTLSGLYTISAASATLLSGDFLRITVAAFLGVIGLVILHVRRPWSISMVLLPIGCGILWTAGVCALGGFTLNFMNICILPMLLGTGSDYGVYIVHRFTSSQRADMPDTLRIAGLGVLLSALTTLEGFGTLALSVNRGLASVGLLSCVGITACILAALTTLPAVLQLWSQPPPREEAGSCVCG
ncbi:MAG: hypothetical protein FJZ47_25345, partial [Candidatus Tectomicrobia bacterium]|nr:hypothetical protein [Candidatus Tectomicrobia bacterium]